MSGCAAECISQAALACLRWALTPGIGPLTFARLTESFGSAAQAWEASAAQLERVNGIGRSAAARIVDARSQAADAASREIDQAIRLGVRIIGRDDPDYPPGLRQVPDAPIVLYVRGQLLPTDAVALAVVGSRHCSIYGGEQARRFGELLAGAGLTVVSGLARGIDALAHHGALDAAGRSIAVLGCGLSHVYPPENLALAERLLERGAWMSELPLDFPVRAENFPARNRIIAGMTLGTLVVEAPLRSGALITARLAAEYNREVFAIPGRVGDPASAGTNALIRDGQAKLVTCLDDILDELGDVAAALRAGADHPRPVSNSGRHGPPAPGPAGASESLADAPAPPVPALSDEERRVLEAVPPEPVLQEQVLQRAALPTGQVLSALTTLELKGLVRRLPGQMVVRRPAAGPG